MTEQLIPTSDRGMHPFPEFCPHWCDRQQHLEYAIESEGCIDAADMTKHRSHCFDNSLPEIRNFANHDIERDGGDGWDLSVGQSLREPYTRHSGYESAPLVELLIASQGKGQQAVIDMTTGEARVMAAQLITLCDLVDLREATR